MTGVILALVEKHGIYSPSQHGTQHNTVGHGRMDDPSRVVYYVA